MDVIGNWFWLLCGAWVGLFGAWDIGRRVQPLVAAGELDADEVHRFTRRYALAISVPCVMLWLLQRSVGSDASPHFDTWPEIQQTIANVLITGLQVALVAWVWFRGGDQILAKHLRVVTSIKSSWGALFWRVIATAVLLANVYYLFFQHQR